MVIYSALHWLDPSTKGQCMFVLEYSVCLYNRVSNIEPVYSPLELWTSKLIEHIELARVNVWVCQFYVLNPKLQDGNKITKWKIRSHMEQFLGFSKYNSSQLGLICNSKTQWILPQYHVVCDKNSIPFPALKGSGILIIPPMLNHGPIYFRTGVIDTFMMK